MHDISYEVKEEISEDPLEKETKTILYIKITKNIGNLTIAVGIF